MLLGWSKSYVERTVSC